MSVNYYGKKLEKGQIFAGDQVARIEIKLLFSVISNENMAKKPQCLASISSKKYYHIDLL